MPHQLLWGRNDNQTRPKPWLTCLVYWFHYKPTAFRPFLSWQFLINLKCIAVDRDKKTRDSSGSFNNWRCHLT